LANDLSTLNSKLATQLRDTANATWASVERDDLLTWAVAGLWPTVARYIEPTTSIVTLVADTYFYALPTGVRLVTEVDWVDPSANELGPVTGYQIVGDAEDGTGKIQVSPTYVKLLGTLRLHGYGVYDTTTNLIKDRHVPLVLAMARAEAYRRMGSDRARFKEWQSQNQAQNVSVNELILLTNEADREVMTLRRQLGKRMLPVLARRA
jgi:hypothetical protein